jgi:hypothetical protein
MVSELLRSIADQDVQAGRDLQPLGSLARRDHRSLHRHCLEDLEPRAGA